MDTTEKKKYTIENDTQRSDGFNETILEENVSYTILTSNACSYCIRKQNEF